MKILKSKRMIAAIAAVASALAISATCYASYSLGPDVYDSINSVTSTAFDLPSHSYTGNDIGATNINITAPSRVDYYLQLYVKDGSGLWYNQYGSSAICDTEHLGGYFWWNSVNTGGGTTSAHFRVERTDSSNITLGGNLISNARTWY